MYQMWYNVYVIIIREHLEEKRMEGFEPKKLALIRILQILKNYSDYNHPLTQEDIARYLDNDYGIVIERKAISRNISLLKEAGFEIESKGSGSYPEEREFETFWVLIDDSQYAFRRDIFSNLWYFGNSESIEEWLSCTIDDYENAKRGILCTRLLKFLH